jgi:hypothetical protein
MNVISGLSALASLPSLLSSGAQRVSGDGDGDHGKESVGKSNFMDAVTHALDQSLSGSSAKTHVSHKTSAAPDATTQDPQVALQGFLQNLFSSLSQASGNTGGQQDSSVAGVGSSHHGSHIAQSLQNLLQQLSSTTDSSSNSSSSSGNSLSQLNSSFQNLVSSINSEQGQGASAPQPTLQAFLQNLMQDVGKGQNISGTIVSTQA